MPGFLSGEFSDIRMIPVLIGIFLRAKLCEESDFAKKIFDYSFTFGHCNELR